ncbi:MAG: MFS transporter [Pseudomonadales bacterium]|nr:MFS transporter [Pseudomonadales bacterium]
MTDQTHPEPVDGEVSPDLSHSAVGTAGAEHLTTGLIWVYSLPRIAFGIMGFLFGTYLMKFATDVLLIAPAAMGTIIAASRLWDGVSDPMAGYLSDRTNSRFGRRRTWMFAASVPMGLALIMIWSPPNLLEGAVLVVWMAVALLLYETASTAFFVPHGAIGPELTPNYHERTRLYGYSHMIGAIGTILGLISLQFMNMAEDKRTFAWLLSLFAGFSVTTIVIWSTKMLPERADYQGRGGVNVYSSFADVFRNPHARLLLIVFAVETFGAASVGMLVPYLVEYVIPMQVMMVPLLLTYTIPQFAFTPIWIRLARRFGKKKLWAFSMWMNAAVFFCYFWITEPGPMVWILSFLLGFAAGCGAVVAPAIKADVIDYDEYMSDERKEGAYLAVWNLVRKCAASVTALVTGLVLQMSGFEPNIEQSETTQLAMRALFGLLPCACYIIGAILFLRFSFNEAEHGAVREELARRALERGKLSA